MLRRSVARYLFKSTPFFCVWAAEADDPNAPPTTFKNVKPGKLLRLWRQIRHRAWILFTWDEEWQSPNQDGYLHQHRLEQVCFVPLSAYGMVPGSYCDPLLYNTKNTSPFRWHVANNSSDIVGHWYVQADEIMRMKQWQPKNPDDPLEMFPRPPSMRLAWDETVDENGNRTFRYKYQYDVGGPTHKWQCYPRYPFAHHYIDSVDHHGRAQPYGFKQGHLLRCDAQEEEVLRRVMQEQDKEWEMVKRTQILQQPWSYPGKIRPQDFLGAVERAKSKFRDQIRQGKETGPSEDPQYDLVQAGEFVQPRDGPRAQWRHLWTSNRKPGQMPQYMVTFNDGLSFEDNENKPPAHPDSHYEEVPKTPPYEKYSDEDSAFFEAQEKLAKEAQQKSFAEAMERHRKMFGDTEGPPKGPKPPLPTGCPPMPNDLNKSNNSSSSSSSSSGGNKSSNKSDN